MEPMTMPKELAAIEVAMWEGLRHFETLRGYLAAGAISRADEELWAIRDLLRDMTANYAAFQPVKLRALKGGSE